MKASIVNGCSALTSLRAFLKAEKNGASVNTLLRWLVLTVKKYVAPGTIERRKVAMGPFSVFRAHSARYGFMHITHVSGFRAHSARYWGSLTAETLPAAVR